MIRRFKDWKIQTKLVTTTLLLVFLPLMVVSNIALARFTANSKADAENTLELIVRFINDISHMQQSLEAEKGEPAGLTFQAEAIHESALRKAVSDITVGQTGYAYIMNSKGKLLIHPSRESETIIDSKDSAGHFYIKEMCKQAVGMKSGQIGTIRYPWVNPDLGEKEPRMKLTKFTYFKDWDWIIAAGSYESEIYAAARNARRSILIIFIFTAIGVIGLTIIISRRLASPMKRVSKAARQMAEGDLSVRLYILQNDEIGEMATMFNYMANQIQQYTDNLQGLVAERTKELLRTKEYFESIIESSADVIITTDKAGKITYVNKAVKKALGYTQDSLIGRHISMLYVKGFQKAKEIMNLLRAKGAFSNYEMPLIVKQGKSVPILTSAALLRDEVGKVIGTVGIFTDITERKKLEAELRRTQASLVQAGKLRAMGDLVAGVAHELNNPLMASQSLVHVMKSSLSADDANARRVDIIEKCNLRMEKIINHLREFSRADEKHLRPIDFNEPIENALMITGQQLLNHNIKLEKDLAKDLPKINGDVNQLEQVYLNLITNAKDAMENTGRPKVLTIKSYGERTTEGSNVVIAFTDNGSGMSEEVMEKIFNPFFSTKETDKGTGLGLAITYGIIEDHQGTVNVKTRLGAGTTFTISIPAFNKSSEQKPEETKEEE